jgi:CTP synthase
MQMAAVEFARNALGWNDADSAEFSEKSVRNVIDLMTEQERITEKGGTMRLGRYPCALSENSLCRKLYGQAEIFERHRHRYEFNNAFRQELTAAGLSLAGLSPDEKLVEIVELPSHPWFVGVQFHPEFRSRPNHPHPLFSGFVDAALRHG